MLELLSPGQDLPPEKVTVGKSQFLDLEASVPHMGCWPWPAPHHMTGRPHSQGRRSQTVSCHLSGVWAHFISWKQDLESSPCSVGGRHTGIWMHGGRASGKHYSRLPTHHTLLWILIQGHPWPRGLSGPRDTMMRSVDSVSIFPQPPVPFHRQEKGIHGDKDAIRGFGQHTLLFTEADLALCCLICQQQREMP